MHEESIRLLLESVRSGEQSIDDAVARLKTLPFEDLGFAKIDHHRGLRCGFPEVIYCEGKTVEQVLAIFDCRAAVGDNVMATRASAEVRSAIAAKHPSADCNDSARTVTLRQREAVRSAGTIAIVAAGTSDMPVAEEARVLLPLLGNNP